MKRQPISSQTIAMTGMLTAVLAVLSILQIPMPSGVPVTLQTFAVALCGYVLGTRRGTLCVILYLLLGCLGLPVFAGMQGGINNLFTFTGGFLYGFLPFAAFCGLVLRFRRMIPAITLGLTGLMLCHLLGVWHYSIVADTDFIPAFLLVSAPYLIKDILCVVGAYIAASALRRAMAKSGIYFEQ